MWCSKIGAALVPIMFAVVMVCGFTTTYIVAVTNDHVRSVFPYISDTGNFHPESSLFTLVCCIAAIFGFIMFFIHYKHTKLLVKNIHFQRCNHVSFYLGLLSGFGLLLIASFQDGATLSAIHYSGALLTFGLGTVYSFIVTAIGWHVSVIYNDRWLKIVTFIRIILCVLMLIGSITVATATSISEHQFYQNANSTAEDKYKWNPDDKGYKVHIVATGTEWFLAAVSLIFFLTFVRSFYRVEMEIVTVMLKQQHGYSRI